jgi:hypothetical protein
VVQARRRRNVPWLQVGKNLRSSQVECHERCSEELLSTGFEASRLVLKAECSLPLNAENQVLNARFPETTDPSTTSKD